MTRILLLGGTSHAKLMAEAIAKAGRTAVYSLAGRTAAPVALPLPTRIGGFGGVDGLRAYLRAEAISHVVDATHPFSTGMSRNAVAACAAEGVPLIALERTPWAPVPGHPWTHVPDIDGAVAALAGPARRVFLAIGRQHIAPFAGQPQHHYLLRFVDPPSAPLPLPHADVVVARGPFDLANDIKLLRDRAIDVVVSKNAGGKGSVAKIGAAMTLGLPVVMIDRPALPVRQVASTVDKVMAWLDR
jgi:precorrin-6A/cobalt-precorrin-6A reductase